MSPIKERLEFELHVKVDNQLSSMDLRFCFLNQTNHFQ